MRSNLPAFYNKMAMVNLKRCKEQLVGINSSETGTIPSTRTIRIARPTEKKTGKNTSIYINQEVRQALSACHLTGLDPDDALFPSHKYKGSPLSRYQAYRVIKKAAVYAGLPEHISCHSLRKTFGYHAWKQSVPPAMLMDIYNHSSYQITKRYLGTDQDDKDQVFEKIRL